ncbi:DNA repair protein RadC [Brevibacillus sp. IT-7CA2]|uniref:RadC family protein n=1 Tax=Brevibacillus sp. IT-7CA2 TaxID=3026436 RepID=UPI0039E05711
MKNSFVQRAKESMIFAMDNVDMLNLLAVLIGPKATPECTGRLASYGAKELSTLSLQELMAVGEIPQSSAERIMAAFALAKRFQRIPCEKVKLLSPSAIANYMMDELRYLDQEHFVCLYTNTQLEVIGKSTVFIGTLDSSIVHPREIFKEAVRRSAAYIVCVHNHPSGNEAPSSIDKEITNYLKKAGDIMDIPLLDHVIIGDGRYYSFKEDRQL